MARNRIFHKRYILEFKGITTNDFMPHFIESMLSKLVESLGQRFKQLEISEIKEEDLRDADA